MRFTIRRIMIVVAVAAVLLATVAEKGPLAEALLYVIQESGWPPLTVVSLFSFYFFGSQWLVVLGWRRPAGAGFWTLAVLANTLYPACCIAPSVRVFQTLRIGWMCVVWPTMTGLGCAWAVLATRERMIPRRLGPVVWLSVVILPLLPMVPLVSCWPLRIAFLAARPTLERLADRVVAEQPVAFPRQAGVFRLVESRIGPVAGTVALVTDANPSGRAGFVRIPPWVVAGARRGTPIFGEYLDIDLGGGWRYRLGR
jgi:hypothetical protein